MLKNLTLVVEVKNQTLCGLITQKVHFLDFEVLPACRQVVTLASHSLCVGWRNSFSAVLERFLQPTLHGCKARI